MDEVGYAKRLRPRPARHPSDFVVQVNGKLLAEIDGPMLKQGLQDMHERAIVLPMGPEHRPDPDRLEARYATFRAS